MRVAVSGGLDEGLTGHDGLYRAVFEGAGQRALVHHGDQLTRVVMPPGGAAGLDDDMANDDVGPALIFDLDRVVGCALAEHGPAHAGPRRCRRRSGHHGHSRATQQYRQRSPHDDAPWSVRGDTIDLSSGMI